MLLMNRTLRSSFWGLRSREVSVSVGWDTIGASLTASPADWCSGRAGAGIGESSTAFAFRLPDTKGVPRLDNLPAGDLLGDASSSALNPSLRGRPLSFFGVAGGASSSSLALAFWFCCMVSILQL